MLSIAMIVLYICSLSWCSSSFTISSLSLANILRILSASSLNNSRVIISCRGVPFKSFTLRKGIPTLSNRFPIFFMSPSSTWISSFAIILKPDLSIFRSVRDLPAIEYSKIFVILSIHLISSDYFLFVYTSKYGQFSPDVASYSTISVWSHDFSIGVEYTTWTKIQIE